MPSSSIEPLSSFHSAYQAFLSFKPALTGSSRPLCQQPTYLSSECWLLSPSLWLSSQPRAVSNSTTATTLAFFKIYVPLSGSLNADGVVAYWLSWGYRRFLGENHRLSAIRRYSRSGSCWRSDWQGWLCFSSFRLVFPDQSRTVWAFTRSSDENGALAVSVEVRECWHETKLGSSSCFWRSLQVTREHLHLLHQTSWYPIHASSCLSQNRTDYHYLSNFCCLRMIAK